MVDAFTDIGMGRIVDRLPASGDGKFRPWLKRICVPVAFVSFLMYQSVLASAPMSVKIIYMFITYILWGINVKSFPKSPNIYPSLSLMPKGLPLLSAFINLPPKRVKLHVHAAELYPEDYDFSIIFETVEDRKIRHDMERKYTAETIQKPAAEV